MNQNEQAAFVNAYANNVAYASEDEVADFVARYYSEEDTEYSEHYTSIVDALGVWRAAIAFANNHKGE